MTKENPMFAPLSAEVQREVELTIRLKASETRVLDVYATAEEIRRKHVASEIRLEDLASTVARLGSQYGFAIELGEHRVES